MRKLCLCVLLMSFAVTIGFRISRAQTADASSVIKLDPSLDDLVAPDAKVEIVEPNAFQNTEGPVWVSQGKDGFLLFSDVASNAIEKFEPGCDKVPCPIESGKLSVYMDHSGFSEAELASGKVQFADHAGSVGLAIDPQGRLVLNSPAEHSVVRIEKDGTRTTLASTYDGKKFSCPNKVIIKSDGAIYMTDASTSCLGGEKSPDRQMDYHGFFLIKDGKVTLLGKDPEGNPPHGIAMSPDEKILYIGTGKKIVAYDIQPDDTVANERLFVDSNAAQGGLDGINVDMKGNAWFSGPGGIWIVSPDGKHLGTISAPPVQGVRFANLAFGDSDRKTLYMVGGKNLCRIRLRISGARPKKS